MINLIKVVEQVSSSLEFLSIDSTLCSKVISNLSSCSKCIDVCPTRGITISDQNIEITSCTNCGLCTVECTTGALSVKNPSIANLLSKVEYYSKQTNDVYIHCSKHIPTRKDISTIQVPCIASIHTEMWLIFLKAATTYQVYLPEKGCSTCDTVNSDQLLWQEINKVQVISNENFRFVNSEHQLTSNEDISDNSKRQWLNSIFSFTKQAPKNIINNWSADAGEGKQDQTVNLKSPRRKLLSYFLQKNPSEAKLIKIKVAKINEKCQFCGACSILCPNKAIKQVEGSLEIKPLLCSECFLCQDICYYDAIQLVEQEAQVLLD